MPYFNANNKLIERPGNYIITDINIIPYHREGDEGIFRQIITDQVVEFSIYESVENNFLSGDMSIVDGVNLINMLPLTGFERLEFKLYTPGEQKGYDFSVLTGHPMMITGIRNKTMLKDRIQSYTLEFCSIERVKNDLTRVSRSFSGTTDNIILDVCRTELDTKKNIIIEPTKSVAKYVAPRKRPIEIINDVGKLSESKNFENAGYLFYETGVGYHFKSYESMFCDASGTARPVRARYSPKIVTYRDNKGDKDIINALQSVSSFRLKSQYNTLRHLAAGTFASRMVIHDSFNKTFEEIDFDYHKQYEKENHLESDEQGQKRGDNGVVPFFNFSEGKTISDFKEGTLHFQSFTDKVHNDYDFLGRNSNITQKRISQKAALSSIVLELDLPGFTGISVGEVVHFTHPSFKPIKKSTEKDFDPYLSGRYLITSIKHMVNLKITKKHKMLVELVKDSFNKSLPEDEVDLFTGQENEQGDSYLQYSLDEA
jgi:hypothetical protein